MKELIDYLYVHLCALEQCKNLNPLGQKMLLWIRKRRGRLH